MAAFDGNGNPAPSSQQQMQQQNAEKSAFAFDDDDGDLGSDIDDSPQIVQMGSGIHQGLTKNLSGIENGAFSIRQQHLVEEQKESISLSEANSKSVIGADQEAGDKEGAGPHNQQMMNGQAQNQAAAQ